MPFYFNFSADAAYSTLHLTELNVAEESFFFKRSATVNYNAVARVDLSTESIKEESMCIKFASISFLNAIYEPAIRNREEAFFSYFLTVKHTVKELNWRLHIEAVQEKWLLPFTNSMMWHTDEGLFLGRIGAFKSFQALICPIIMVSSFILISIVLELFIHSSSTLIAIISVHFFFSDIISRSIREMILRETTEL